MGGLPDRAEIMRCLPPFFYALFRTFQNGVHPVFSLSDLFPRKENGSFTFSPPVSFEDPLFEYPLLSLASPAAVWTDALIAVLLMNTLFCPFTGKLLLDQINGGGMGAGNGPSCCQPEVWGAESGFS
jgi:hypothetical protein